MEQRFKPSFRFHRTKKDRFIWTDDKQYKVIFHTPRIQTFDYEMPITPHNGILYYYYDMELWTKPYDENWKLFARAWAHDFPAIQYLTELMEEFLTSDMQKGSERFSNGNGGLTYQKSLSSLHAWSEDFYDIRRIQNIKEWYEMFIGAYDKALAITHLCEQDLRALLKCAEAFYKYSCDAYNKDIALILKRLRNTFRCQDGKLCERELDEKNHPTGKLLETYSIGDNIILRALDKGNPERHSVRMYGTLTAVSEKEVTLSVTYRTNDEEEIHSEGTPETVPLAWIMEVEEERKR